MFLKIIYEGKKYSYSKNGVYSLSMTEALSIAEKVIAIDKEIGVELVTDLAPVEKVNCFELSDNGEILISNISEDLCEDEDECEDECCCDCDDSGFHNDHDYDPEDLIVVKDLHIVPMIINRKKYEIEEHPFVGFELASLPFSKKNMKDCEFLASHHMKNLNKDIRLVIMQEHQLLMIKNYLNDFLKNFEKYFDKKDLFSNEVPGYCFLNGDYSKMERSSDPIINHN